MSRGRADDELTTEEAAAVLRRAAELDEAADGPAVVGRVHVSSLEQAAVEVGVAPEAIHQALAELRVGALPVGPEATGGAGRGLVPARRAGPGPGTDVRTPPTALRLLDEPPGQVLTNLDHVLRQQLFELRRRDGDRQLWRRRTDRAAKLQHRVDRHGRLLLREIASIAVSLSPVDHSPSRTLVRLEAGIDGPEGPVSPGAVVAGAGSALLVTTNWAEVAVVLAGGGAALAGRRILRRRARHRDRHREAAELLDWVLDQVGPAHGPG